MCEHQKEISLYFACYHLLLRESSRTLIMGLKKRPSSPPEKGARAYAIKMLEMVLLY